MNGQVEVTKQTLQTIKNSRVVHTQVYDEYVNFALMYTTGHTFTVIPTKHLVNQYDETTASHIL